MKEHVHRLSCLSFSTCVLLFVCTFVYVYVSVCLLWGLSVIVSVLHLPSCRAPKASACQFVGPLKSRLTGTDPERIKEM